MEEFLKVGTVSSTHGLKGEVKVFPATDDPKRFLELEKVLLDSGRGRVELAIEGVKFFKRMVILKFRGIDRIEDVEEYRGKTLWVPREDAVKLAKDEYFVADLIGSRVVTDEGMELGTLTDVMETGANDVYVVKRDAGGEVLLPAIKECVLEVDVAGQKILVHLMPGLLEE